MNEERVVLSGPLSCEAHFRLVIAGDYTGKEAAKLIEILALQREWLGEEEAAAKAPLLSQERR